MFFKSTINYIRKILTNIYQNLKIVRKHGLILLCWFLEPRDPRIGVLLHVDTNGPVTTCLKYFKVLNGLWPLSCQCQITLGNILQLCASNGCKYIIYPKNEPGVSNRCFVDFSSTDTFYWLGLIIFCSYSRTLPVTCRWTSRNAGSWELPKLDVLVLKSECHCWNINLKFEVLFAYFIYIRFACFKCCTWRYLWSTSQ